MPLVQLVTKPASVTSSFGRLPPREQANVRVGLLRFVCQRTASLVRGVARGRTWSHPHRHVVRCHPAHSVERVVYGPPKLVDLGWTSSVLWCLLLVVVEDTALGRVANLFTDKKSAQRSPHGGLQEQSAQHSRAMPSCWCCLLKRAREERERSCERQSGEGECRMYARNRASCARAPWIPCSLARGTSSSHWGRRGVA
jgi:hypothetical protein